MRKKIYRDLLPPPKEVTYHRSTTKYIVLPEDLYKDLATEAIKRGWKTREFALAILRNALTKTLL